MLIDANPVAQFARAGGGLQPPVDDAILNQHRAGLHRIADGGRGFVRRQRHDFRPAVFHQEYAAGADKEVPAAGGAVYRRQPFAVFDIQPQRRVGLIVNAAVHRHLHPAVAIDTRQQRTQGTPGFAVPILPVHRNALFLRIHPIALQGQRRVGEGTGGAGDGGQGQQRQREQAT